LLNPEAAAVTVLRVSQHDLPATLSAVDDVWRAFAPEIPLLRRFADEQFEQSYSFLNALNAVFAFLACLASAIAVIGLVGMTLHLIERRTHEIAVRKTLGASTRQMLWLLFRGFAKPIVLANVIVWPLAFGAMRMYLGMFDHSFGLGWAPFVVSLGGTLLVAWLAVGGQVVRAARLSPVKVLRYE
jgi:putative ABC transport system permease protein